MTVATGRGSLKAGLVNVATNICCKLVATNICIIYINYGINGMQQVAT